MSSTANHDILADTTIVQPDILFVATGRLPIISERESVASGASRGVNSRTMHATVISLVLGAAVAATVAAEQTEAART